MDLFLSLWLNLLKKGKTESSNWSSKLHGILAHSLFANTSSLASSSAFLSKKSKICILVWKKSWGRSTEILLTFLTSLSTTSKWLRIILATVESLYCTATYTIDLLFKSNSQFKYREYPINSMYVLYVPGPLLYRCIIVF